MLDDHTFYDAKSVLFMGVSFIHLVCFKFVRDTLHRRVKVSLTHNLWVVHWLWQTVRAFRGESGMQKFRDWVLKPDEGELLAAVRPQRKRKRKKQIKAGDERADAGAQTTLFPTIKDSGLAHQRHPEMA